MNNRRQVLENLFAIGLGLATTSLVRPTWAKTTLPEGFHHQDWFYKSSFDLRKDQHAAQKDNKELVLLWEQIGCTYCRQMHELVFTRPDIVELINQNFNVVQMDLWGSREFTALNGETMDEAQLARNYYVNTTPTTQFFNAAGEVTFQAPGYVPPPAFKAVYKYVIEQAYNEEPFLQWIKTQKLDF